MLRTISVVVLVLLMSNVAEACRHRVCRGFSRCRYVKVVPPVEVQPVVIEQQKVITIPQQVINVSTFYPAGNTQYTVGQAAAVYGPNPDLAMTLAAQNANIANSGLTSAITLAMSTVGDVAQVAKLQALRENITAAMGYQQEQKSFSFRVTNDGSGPRIEQIIDTSTPTAETLNNAAAASGSVLIRYCSKCHGTQLTVPKGDSQTFIAPGHELDSRMVLNALRRVAHPDTPADKRMPPAGEPQLTEEEKGLFFLEISKLEREVE